MSPLKFRVRVARNIQTARWRRQLTQERAAEASSLNLRYYREVEQGKRKPTVEVLYKIGQALHITPSELLDVGDLPVDRERLSLPDLRPSLTRPTLGRPSKKVRRGRKTKEGSPRGGSRRRSGGSSKRS